MIIELNDIKEVKISPKASFKYYMLFVYNKNLEAPNHKYFLLHQSVDLDDLEHHKKTWVISDADEFRVFVVNLPS
jgi:hypothetical protein